MPIELTVLTQNLYGTSDAQPARRADAFARLLEAHERQAAAAGEGEGRVRALTAADALRRALQNFRSWR